MLPYLTILLLELNRPSVDGSMVRLGLEELRKMHTLMARDLSGIQGLPQDDVLATRFFIAQPVNLCATSQILRMAIGAPLVTRLYRSKDQPSEFAAVLREDEALVKKMD